jgi:hypothetical protein
VAIQEQDAPIIGSYEPAQDSPPPISFPSFPSGARILVHGRPLVLSLGAPLKQVWPDAIGCEDWLIRRGGRRSFACCTGALWWDLGELIICRGIRPSGKTIGLILQLNRRVGVSDLLNNVLWSERCRMCAATLTRFWCGSRRFLGLRLSASGLLFAASLFSTSVWWHCVIQNYTTTPSVPKL